MKFMGKYQDQEILQKAKDCGPRNDGITAMVSMYWNYVKMCDEATDELESKARDITRRIAIELEKIECCESDCEPKSSIPMNSQNTENMGDGAYIDSKEFSRRADLARRFQVPLRVLAGSCFVLGAKADELAELETLDVKITLLRYRMDAIELDILDEFPSDAENALAKLKFLSALLIDGAEIDVDHFAYITNECAEFCSRELSRIRGESSGKSNRFPKLSKTGV